MQRYVFKLDADRLAGALGELERVLRSEPKFAFAVVDPRRAVHRLHRRVGKIRDPILGLDRHCRCIQSLCGITDRDIDLFIAPLGRAVEIGRELIEDVTLFPTAVTAVVEFDLQIVKRLPGLPVTVGDNRDSGVEVNNL